MDGAIVFPEDTLLDFLMLLNENWTELSTRRSSPRCRGFASRRASSRRTTRRCARAATSSTTTISTAASIASSSIPTCSIPAPISSGPDARLEEAQWAKKRHLASKLALEPGQQVLDIGSGWGGLGLFLADYFDVDVTGVTLSTEQHAVSNQRARERGLDQAARASSSRTTARSTRSSTASSPSACSSMSAPRATASSSAPPRGC